MGWALTTKRFQSSQRATRFVNPLSSDRWEHRRYSESEVGRSNATQCCFFLSPPVPKGETTQGWRDWAKEHLSPEEEARISKLKSGSGEWITQVNAAAKLKGTQHVANFCLLKPNVPSVTEEEAR